jgi:hypothetical protein
MERDQQNHEGRIVLIRINKLKRSGRLAGRFHLLFASLFIFSLTLSGFGLPSLMGDERALLRNPRRAFDIDLA